MPPTNELTTDYRSTDARGEAPVNRIEVARVRGTGRLPSSDLQSLLHKRLRAIAFLLAAGMAIVVLLVLFSPGNSWYAVEVYCLVFVVGAAVAGGIWKKSSLTLRQLRVIELATFGTSFAFWSLVHAVLYPTFRLEKPAIWFPSIMAHSIALPRAWPKWLDRTCIMILTRRHRLGRLGGLPYEAP